MEQGGYGRIFNYSLQVSNVDGRDMKPGTTEARYRVAAFGGKFG